jgi:hypothetical protein
VIVSSEPLERGTFDTAEFAGELRRAPDNHEIGTTLRFENDVVRVFDITLPAGVRCPFHVHDRAYFWTVVESGRGLQRYDDGTYIVKDYELGETRFLTHSPEHRMIHDLENVGDTTLRFVTVEFKE